jgi:hypothetical protein
MRVEAQALASSRELLDQFGARLDAVDAPSSRALKNRS